VAGLDSLSAERVTGEMLKLLAADDPRQAARLMEEAGVLGRAVPGARTNRAFEALIAITGDPVERLAGLFQDTDAAEAALARLRLPNAAAARLRAIVGPGEVVSLDMGPQAARAALYRQGRAAFEDRLRRAWAHAPGRGAEATALLALAADWPIPRLPVGGADVAALGVAPGPETGRLLAEVERWWIDNDFPEAGVRERLAELLQDPE
jgi:poly(A) polymerase